jgi:hypothetical protein
MHRTESLLLHHDSARQNTAAERDVFNVQLHQITAMNL